MYRCLIVFTVAAAAGAAHANVDGTLMLTAGPPEASNPPDPLLAQPSTILAYTLSCDAPSPQYSAELVPIQHTVDGTPAEIDTGVNLGIAPPDSGPTSGMVTFFASPGQKIRAVWIPGAIVCGPGIGMGNMGGGPNIAEIDSNDLLLPPYVDPLYLQGDPHEPNPQSGEPFMYTLPVVANAFIAAPSGSETATIDVTGCGLNFSKTYNATDWKNLAYAADVQALAPTMGGQVAFSITFNPYNSKSTVQMVTVVQSAGACEACKQDVDCLGYRIDNHLSCKNGVCDANASCSDNAAAVCGSYGCASGSSCGCPGSPTTNKPPASKSPFSCSVGSSTGGGASSLLLSLAVAALFVARRRRAR